MLKQRVNDVQSPVGATATRAHVEAPLRRRELFVHSCSVRHQTNCCASTREIPATWIPIRTQGTERCSCDKTAALSRRKHTWISLRAQRDMFHRKHCCDLALPLKIDEFYLRTPDPVSTLKRAHVRYATRNPGHRANALHIVNPISVYAVGELSL